MGSEIFHPQIEFVRNILSKLNKIYLSKSQKGNLLSVYMKTYLSSPSCIPVQCCLLTTDSSSTLYNGREKMREGEIQFHSKIESVQNILSKIADRLPVLWPVITSNIVFQQITFFLPFKFSRLNETNIKTNSYFPVASIDIRD